MVVAVFASVINDDNSESDLPTCCHKLVISLQLHLVMVDGKPQWGSWWLDDLSVEVWQIAE